MPERTRDPKHNIMDFIFMFFPEFDDEPREGVVTILGTPTQKFTSEQRQMLNNIKKRAQDVEFEEIQG